MKKIIVMIGSLILMGSFLEAKVGYWEVKAACEGIGGTLGTNADGHWICSKGEKFSRYDASAGNATHAKKVSSVQTKTVHRAK